MRLDKSQAIKLRNGGMSYNEISRTLRIAKGTLATWFKKDGTSILVKEENISKAKKIWAQNITDFNKKRSKEIREGWQLAQSNSRKDIGIISQRELFLIGVALYWAEGLKRTNWNLIFCNSDPTMIKIMMRFFLEICGVAKEKIKVQIQIYENISSTEAISYWSHITGLPKTQFYKPLILVNRQSKLKRGNTLPFGTIRLRINDVNLVNRIKGWIQGISLKN